MLHVAPRRATSSGRSITPPVYPLTVMSIQNRRSTANATPLLWRGLRPFGANQTDGTDGAGAGMHLANVERTSAPPIVTDGDNHAEGRFALDPGSPHRAI